jgi:hypothetical protein
VLALGACGGGEEGGPAPAPPGPEENDAILLNRLLDVELALVAAYELGTDVLEGPARREGRRILAHERSHVERVSGIVQALGGSPKQPRSDEDYRSQFPSPSTPADMLRFAVDLENKMIKAYGDAVPRLKIAGHRRLAASIMASEAQHTSVLLGLLAPGDPAAQAPEAFVTGVASAS